MFLFQFEFHTFLIKNSGKLIPMFLVSQACEIYDQTEQGNNSFLLN